MHRWSLPLTFCVLGALTVLISPVACRRQEPPPAVPKNLGTADRPLLPTESPSYDESILSGRAAPVLAAELAQEEPADQPAPGGNGGDEELTYIAEAVESAVRAAAEQKYDEFADYVVAAQREPLGRLVAAAGKLLESFQALGTTIQEKAPTVVEQAKGLLGSQASLPGLTGGEAGGQSVDQIVQAFTVNNLKMTRPDTAAGVLGAPGFGLPIEFELVDEEWYLRLPDPLLDPELVAGLVQLLEAADAKAADITTRLDSGDLSPEQVMPELAAAVQELQPMLLALVPKLQAVRAALGPGGLDVPEGAEVSEADRAQIVELVEFLNEALASRQVDGLIELAIPAERDRVRVLYASLGRMLSALDALAQAMEEKTPGSGASLRAVEEQLAPRLTTEGLRQVEPGKAEAVAMVNGGLVRRRFELIEGEWYFRDPVMALDDGAVQARAQALGAAAEQIDALVAEVESGAVSPAQALPRLDMILSAVVPASAPEGEPPEAAESEEEPAEEEPEEPSESPPRPPPQPPAQPAGGGIG